MKELRTWVQRLHSLQKLGFLIRTSAEARKAGLAYVVVFYLQKLLCHRCVALLVVLGATGNQDFEQSETVKAPGLSS